MKMFKVVETEDGLTRIVCKDTGKLICTVRGSGKGIAKVEVEKVGVGCRIPRPVNIVEPSPKPSIREVLTIARDAKPRLICQIPPIIGHHVEPITSKNFKVSAFSQNFIPYPEVTEDYSDDCINQDEFMRCLNAIPSKSLKEKKFDKLSSKFPLRWISRSRPSEISQQLPDIKMYDDADLCSPLGRKLLKANHSRNLISDPTALMCIKKYDSYCRFALSSTYLSGCNFPKLRCREMKRHPLTFRPQKTWNLDECHMYSFTRKQRLEKLKTLRAGLNKKSRKLKILCENKQLRVTIKKLSKEEIKTWTERETTVPVFKNVSNQCQSPRSDSPETPKIKNMYKNRAISEPVSKQGSSVVSERVPQSISLLSIKKASSNADSTVTVQNMCNVVETYHSALSPEPCSQFLNKTYFYHYKNVYFRHFGNFSGKFKKSSVRLRNILHMVIRVNNEYYVKGTSIKISNFPFFPNNLSCQKEKTENICVSLPVFRLDHSYHRVMPKETCNHTNKRELEHRYPVLSSHLNVVEMERRKTRVHSTYSKPISTVLPVDNKKTTVPIIDLTDDETKQNNTLSVAPLVTVKAPIVAQKLFSPMWVFHCFGCGHKRVFNQKISADDDVMEHMQQFHSVSQPDLFLSSYLDTINHRVIIEAFPGYKTSFIG